MDEGHMGPIWWQIRQKGKEKKKNMSKMLQSTTATNVSNP
jgi:hypothetical protein